MIQKFSFSIVIFVLLFISICIIYAGDIVILIGRLIRKVQADRTEEQKISRDTKYSERYHHAQYRQKYSIPARLDGIAHQLNAYQKQQKANERRRATREILTVAGLFTAAFFAALQWAIFRQQASDFRDQERRQLRAYISIDKPSVSGLFLGGSPFAWVHLVNSGQTPAMNVHSGARWAIKEFPLGPPPQLPGFDWNMTTRSNEPIGPHMEKIKPTERLPIWLASEPIGGIRSGKSAFYMYGEAHYEDVFGQPWHTRWCFFLSGAILLPHGAPDGVIAYAEGNDADEEDDETPPCAATTHTSLPLLWER